MTGIITILRGQEELEELLARGKFVLVDHSIQGCGPCVQLARMLHTLAPQYPDVIFAKMDVQETADNVVYAEVHDFEGYPWVHLYNPRGELACDDMPIDAKLKAQLETYLLV